MFTNCGGVSPDQKPECGTQSRRPLFAISGAHAEHGPRSWRGFTYTKKFAVQRCFEFAYCRNQNTVP